MIFSADSFDIPSLRSTLLTAPLRSTCLTMAGTFSDRRSCGWRRLASEHEIEQRGQPDQAAGDGSGVLRGDKVLPPAGDGERTEGKHAEIEPLGRGPIRDVHS